MNTGNLIGAFLSIKLLNGKIKPKFNMWAYIVLLVMFLLFICSVIGLIYGIFNFDLELIGITSLGIFGFGGILMLSPYTQKSSNYRIELINENSLADFKMYYKQKLVRINYKIDGEGKIAFDNNASKLSCISYADGSKMSNIDKYKIINYFGRWLNDNDLMSNEITLTFEEL